MPRHIEPPKSIDDYGGLYAYLDATKDKHRGLGSREFKIRMRPRQHPISKAANAEDFNVSTRTWYDWLKRYERERTTSEASGPAGSG